MALNIEKLLLQTGYKLVIFTALSISPAILSSASYSSSSDEQIKQIMIEASIKEYPGPCPCPYNLARNNSKCGKRSAWTKPGGYEPLCYPSDITPDMVDDYRRTGRLP